MDRLKDNLAVLDFLYNCLHKYPFLRFEQLLWNLDNGKDRFNEEPNITLQRWSKKLNL